MLSFSSFVKLPINKKQKTKHKMVKHRSILFFLFFASLSAAQERNSIAADYRIVTEIIEPFQVMSDGQLTGTSVEFVIDVFKQASLPIPEIEVYPWPRAYKTALENEDTFIFAMVRTPERENKFNWVGLIAESTFALYGLKSDESIAINSLQDAQQFEIAMMQNDVAHDYFRQKGFTEGKNLRIMSERKIIEKLFFNQRLKVIISSPNRIKQQAKLFGQDPEAYEAKYFLSDLTVRFYLAANPHTNAFLIKTLQKHWPVKVLQY